MDSATVTSKIDPTREVTATVGGPISFKADVEQRTRVKEIRYGGWNGSVPQVRVDVAEGHYAGKNRWIDLADCWN